MRSRTLAAALLTFALATGCSTPAEEAEQNETSPSVSAETGDWPRVIEHAAGETTIDEKPVRIVSTSPSITGSLLALDAPLAASAATTVNPLTDDRGFFTQWASVAEERGVEVLYADLQLDIDAVDLFEPDLIIGSVNGGDSTADAYPQLSEIAPTVLLDYGTVTWQELTATLGEITGLEDQAAATIAEYDTWVSERASKIELPEQPVTALVYLGADGVWAFGESSPQAHLLESLGFTYLPVPEAARAEQKAGANGVDIVSPENLPSAFAESQTLFAVALGGGDPVAALKAEPLLANQPAIVADRAFSLGSEAFRLDYFSAKNTVDLVVEAFAG